MQGWCEEFWDSYDGYEEGALRMILYEYHVPLPEPPGEEDDHRLVQEHLAAT